MKEVFKETYESINTHKVRALLTGFGIAWGMFILIVLLGVSNGVRSGILSMFEGYAANSIRVLGQKISQASVGGIQSGSRVKFDESIFVSSEWYTQVLKGDKIIQKKTKQL